MKQILMLLGAVMAQTKVLDGKLCTIAAADACSTTGSCCATLSLTSGGVAEDTTTGVCVKAGTTSKTAINNINQGIFTSPVYYV